MNIGIIGSGVVAQALGAGFAKYGHKVTLGTRSPEKLAKWRADHEGTEVGSFADAAAADIVVLAVKGTVVADALGAAGRDNLTGKTIIDATNPIADKPPVNGVLRFFTSFDDSLMEQLQRAYPDAHFVKAFNSVGSAFMVNPEFRDGKPTMFICGNDDKAKGSVSEILNQFGWDIADMGSAEAARAIEPLCMLWCIPGFQRNEWSHAFKLLKK